VAQWPVEVAEVALIGHSMGGLLGRSACHYGREEPWIDRVRHVFSLGSPHKGAPLEQAAYLACAALSKLPETRPIAGMINARSAGVKDLGRGYLVDEDWMHEETVGFLRKMGSEVPFLPNANHYFISATLTRDPEAPVGRAIGDLLVLRPSAWAQGGRGERLRFPLDNYRHVGGANHFDLLNHPAVYAQLARWLSGRAVLEAGSAPVAVATEH
jgi:pimeloyl-ACP methyl ester carboxylesterase